MACLPPVIFVGFGTAVFGGRGAQGATSAAHPGPPPRRFASELMAVLFACVPLGLGDFEREQAEATIARVCRAFAQEGNTDDLKKFMVQPQQQQQLQPQRQRLQPSTPPSRPTRFRIHAGLEDEEEWGFADLDMGKVPTFHTLEQAVAVPAGEMQEEMVHVPKPFPENNQQPVEQAVTVPAGEMQEGASHVPTFIPENFQQPVGQAVTVPAGEMHKEMVVVPTFTPDINHQLAEQAVTVPAGEMGMSDVPKPLPEISQLAEQAVTVLAGEMQKGVSHVPTFIPNINHQLEEQAVTELADEMQNGMAAVPTFIPGINHQLEEQAVAVPVKGDDHPPLLAPGEIAVLERGLAYSLTLPRNPRRDAEIEKVRALLKGSPSGTVDQVSTNLRAKALAVDSTKG